MTALMASRRKAADRKARRKEKARRIAKVRPVKIGPLQEKFRKELHAAIRARDGAVCISCGKTGLVHGMRGTWNAGHMFAVGPYPALRFHPLNIHSQCSACNCDQPRFGGRRGNVAAYVAAFIRRYGLETFQALDAIKSEPVQWRVPDLLDLRSALARGLDAYAARYFELMSHKVLGEAA